MSVNQVFLKSCCTNKWAKSPAIFLKPTNDHPLTFQKGIKNQLIKLIAKIKTGAKLNNDTLASFGFTLFLIISLKPSAIGWSNPHIPTRFGPFRRWIDAMILRSASV
jgi:hypothetical protein